MSQITIEKLKETIELAEARTRTSTDEESLRELFFLAEHYTLGGLPIFDSCSD